MFDKYENQYLITQNRELNQYCRLEGTDLLYIHSSVKKERRPLRSKKRGRANINCTIPSWLSEEAKRAGVNFSQILQDALIVELNISK